MFGNKEKIADLQKQIDDLTWRLENPPKYKVGDKDKKYGTCYDVKFIPTNMFYSSLGNIKIGYPCYKYYFIKDDKKQVVS